jgi:hypothetical protein
MRAFLQKIFKVYPEEVRLLLWVTLIQLAMRVSSVLVNNYAQTAFLKRFGVEYLPTIFLIEAILTFFFINTVGMLMERHRSVRVFTWLLLFFAAAMAVIWGLLPLNLLIIYPILFILKSMAIETLPILYWDILSDLFTTRQSKRLFTLITAGGVLGTTIGSLMTGKVARWVGVDNVLLIFVGGTILAALLNERTERVVGSPIQPRTDRVKKKKPKLSETLREVRNFSKRSPFLKYMILLVAIPNIVLPILTYQFNVVVDVTYASEQETLNFLGIFRGVSNAFIFLVLMFSGRLVSRWGVPTSLMFHPINYLLAFASLFFHFDIFSAIYARFSTETLKSTLNNPARAVLYNFFPSRMGGLVRVFLRGTVVRASDLAGSGALILLKGIMDPRTLSLVAAPLVSIWVLTTFLIKRRYPSLLVKVLMDKQIDWRRLEDVDLRTLAQDQKTLDALRRGLKEQSAEIAVLCAEILAQISPPGWCSWIVDALPAKPREVQETLLNLLKPSHAAEAGPCLLAAAQNAPPGSLHPILIALARLDPQGSLPFMQSLLDHSDPQVWIPAMVGVLRGGNADVQEPCRQNIRGLLESGDPEDLRLALEVLKETGDPAFSRVLLRIARAEDPHLKALALLALSGMGLPENLDVAMASIEDPVPQVRRAAAQLLLACGHEVSVDQAIRLLGDEDPQVREMARRAVAHREDVARTLIPVLASPSRILREQVLTILDEVESRPLDLSQFATRELEKAYGNLASFSSLRTVEGGKTLPLLRDHLLERNQAIQETVLRVLAVQDGRENMQVILKALRTKEKRDMDNAIEALESALHSGIRKVMIPLLEQIPIEEKLTRGRKHLRVALDGNAPPEITLLDRVKDDDPVTQALALYALCEMPAATIPVDEVRPWLHSNDPRVRDAARSLLQTREGGEPAPGPTGNGVPFIDKVLQMRRVPMFANLHVRELMAIGTIALETRCSRGDDVVREGDQGDALFLVFEGALSVVKGWQSGHDVVLARIGTNDFFGEMALFDREPRSATVLAETDATLLKIEGEAFDRLMRHYPAIPMNICLVFSQRMRSLHERLPQARGEATEAGRM